MSGLMSSALFKNIYLQIEKLTRFIPDEPYLKMVYRIRMGKKLNLENPQTFNEKLQWLKLYDRKPIYTTMVDKYEAKKYVAGIIGEEYIIPTLGVWNHFDEIDFDKLPDQFVLKCTHDSGGLVIVRDKSKFDKEAAKKKIEKSLKRNFYWKGREWPYKDVKPRIIAEKYMEDKTEDQISDYKVYDFEGNPEIIQVDFDRFIEHKRNLYTKDWDYIEGELKYPSIKDRHDVKPDNLNQMIQAAKMLSEKITFLRTDFYLIDGKLYFGELTLFPESGFENFKPEDLDREYGKCIILPGGGVLLKSDNYMLWVHASAAYNSDTTECSDLKDYKIFTFDGIAKALFVASDRSGDEETKFDFYDAEFRHLPFTNGHPNAAVPPAKPETFNKMKELSYKLSKDLPHCRVDFYEVNGQTYFGELTFSHWSGLVPFVPDEWDKTFGEWITLPKKIGGGIALIAEGFVLWIHEDSKSEDNSESLHVYKFFCFNGKPHIVQVIQNDKQENESIDYFDTEWKLMDLRQNFPNSIVHLDKPKKLQKMLEVTRKLSQGHPFLRVDLYDTSEGIFFSEFTFFSDSGMERFYPDKWDDKLGRIL